MKQQHQIKIKSMQKFVPFLSKLLVRLKTESGNETKIGQIQLFLDLLKFPDASVTIEELDKCEHELSGLYESYENDVDCAGGSTENQLSQATHYEDNLPLQSLNEQIMEGEVKDWQNSIVNRQEMPVNEKLQSNSFVSKLTLETTKITAEQTATKEIEKNKESSNEERHTELSLLQPLNNKDDNSDIVKIDLLKDANVTNIKDNLSKEFILNGPHVEEINEIKPVDDQKFESTAAVPEDSEDGDIEENVEIVKYPEVETDEMILPDSVGEETNTLHSSEEDITVQSEGRTACQKEFSADDDPTAEPELVFALGSVSKDDEKNENYDPLNVDESVSKTDKEISTAAKKDDDDDDVQVIETRNSPICVDSDDDSEPPQTTPNIVKNKSKSCTKKVQNIAPQTSNKSKSGSLQNKPTKILPINNTIIDTIDLLDSSDEEKQYIKPALISPAKRCLLPKPIRQSKRKRSPSTLTTSVDPQIRSASRTPTQIYISTPQSNFLNAVNLRPANTTNPPAFSAQLLNKNIIIPNAFYGNPPEMRFKNKANKTLQGANKGQTAVTSESREQYERNCRRWLDNFLINFASPFQTVSHSCFVLLQQVLKHKQFQKLKEARTNLNMLAKRQLSNDTPASLDIQLMLDLRHVLFTTESQLSETGFRFCELASSQYYGRTVALTTDIKSKRVTSRTRADEEFTTPNKYLNSLPNPTLNHANGYNKKSKKDDGDEYTPNKPVFIEGQDGDSVHGERKRSLRRNRSKRYDNNFSYNEDQNDDEYDEDDDSYAAIAHKVEQKRREAQQKRERMAKSFESAFIEAFSKQIDVKRQKQDLVSRANNAHKKAISDSSTVFKAGVSSCAESLVVDNQQFENSEGFNDGPKEHRIYKIAPTSPYTTPERQSICATKKASSPPDEVITCSDGSDDNEDCDRTRMDLAALPKNTNRSMFISPKNNDITNSFCIICRRQVQRIVHHYVNQHRGCEVYTSRLSSTQLTQLRRNGGNLAKVSLYKNGQNQYEATCPFCQKRSRFMLSYWYQHFTMHTGEYCYRCSGCGTRKPTRPLLLAHLKTPCRKGASICQDFLFEAKTNQIEARMCTLCNYIQLHRSNVVKHIRTQHGLQDILPKHIQSVFLLKIPLTLPTAPTAPMKEIPEFSEIDSVSSSSNTEENTNSNMKKFFNDIETASTVQFNYDDDDPSDDLSFMICGMLDVQMNAD